MDRDDYAAPQSAPVASSFTPTLQYVTTVLPKIVTKDAPPLTNRMVALLQPHVDVRDAVSTSAPLRHNLTSWYGMVAVQVPPPIAPVPSYVQTPSPSMLRGPAYMDLPDRLPAEVRAQLTAPLRRPGHDQAAPKGKMLPAGAGPAAATAAAASNDANNKTKRSGDTEAE
jgi:hypothetical protein